MKIGIIAAYFYPAGAEGYPERMAEILKNENHDVDVITTNIDPNGRLIKNDSYKGIKVNRQRTYLHYGEFATVWFPKVKYYDVIHCCGGYRHLHTFYTYLMKGKSKFIISPFFPEHQRDRLLHKFFIPIMDRTIGKYLLRHADYCLAETEKEKNWLKKFGVKKIFIIPNPIPISYFKNGDGMRFRDKFNIKGKMVFCLGAHVPIKNFEEIIKVIPNIDATFVIGGEETEYTNKCKRLAESLGINNKIKWVGYLDDENKLDAYSASNLFVLTSKRESLGTVLIEAMAQEKPVLASNTGGMSEVVPDKLCLYQPGNLRELGNKINMFLTNRALAKNIGKKGANKARRYSIKNVAKKYISVIKSIK